MASKGISIITPDVNNPGQDVQVFADGVTNALLVKVVNPGGGGGGGVQYNEDSPHTSGDTGTMALVVRKDSAGTLVGADGDYAPLQVDASGALRVVVVSGGGGGGGTQYPEDSAHASGDIGTLALVVRNDTPGSLAGTDGDYAALQVDASGRLRVAVDAAVSLSVGNFPTVYPVNDNGGSLTVDGTVAVTQGGAFVVVVDDGGGSITVDGAVSVSNFPSVYPVNDNGGSLTVDGTVAATQSGAWSVEATQATHADLNATVRLQDRDSASLLSVLAADDTAVFPMTETGILPLFLVTDSPVATLSDFTYGRMNEAGAIYVTLIDSFAKLEGNTHSSGDSGVPAWAVRNDAGTALAVDGSYHPLMVNSTGRLFVDVGTPALSAVTPGTGATNLGKAEDAAHASGDVGVMTLAVRDDGESSLVSAAGDYAPLQVNATGRLKVNTLVESGDGTGELLRVYQGTQASEQRSRGIAPMCEVTDSPSVGTIGVWSHPFLDSNTGGLLVQLVGAVQASLDSSRAEDTAHATGHIGQFILAVRNDTPSALAGTNGDYIPFTTDNTGRLYVNCNTHAVTQSGTWNIGTVTPGSAATNLGKAEDAAHTTGAVGVMALAVRNDTLASSTSANGDYATFSVDSVGALWTRIAGVTTIALSGSTRGRPIQITGTNTAGGVTLHTATTTAGQLDRVFIDLTNTSDNAVLVTIEFGTTGTSNELNITVPPRETVRAVDGMVLGGGATDTIRAYAATGSVINAVGRVERLS
jgi:hypothetical protein